MCQRFNLTYTDHVRLRFRSAGSVLRASPNLKLESARTCGNFDVLKIGDTQHTLRRRVGLTSELSRRRCHQTSERHHRLVRLVTISINSATNMIATQNSLIASLPGASQHRSRARASRRPGSPSGCGSQHLQSVESLRCGPRHGSARKD
jgi:hypothetical protein